MIKRKLVTFLFIILLFVPLISIPTIKVSAKEKTLAEWKSELEEVEKELEETNAQIEQNQEEINATQEKINETYAQLEKINEQIEAKTAESEELEKKIEEKNEETENLMRYYQISSSGSALLEYIMGAESITDLIYRLSITEQISSYNEDIIDEMNSMIKENEQIKEELEASKVEQEELQKELNDQIAKLNETKEDLDEEGHSLEESIEQMKETIEYLEDLGCKESETQTVCLNRLYSSNSSSGSYLPSGTTFYRPTTSGTISSEYGWRTLYGSANMHAAIDISTPNGTTVYSVATGYVAKTIWSSTGGGNQIIIHHLINGQYYTSYYCHLSSINVSVGDIVTKDSIIGYSGSTGNVTGPHLHLGMATGRWYTDYYSYYGSSGFVGHSFDPREVITFPSLGYSYSNR